MTADNKINLPGITEFSDPILKKPQYQRNSYARQLRAMGQALEERHVFSLDLELKGGLYVVRGKITAADYAQSSFSGFHSRLRLGSWIGSHGLPSPVDL